MKDRPPRLRLVTYNIHKCIGGVDRRLDPRRVRDVIASHEPDLVLLQEAGERIRDPKGPKQADLLADMIGMRHRVYYPNVRLRRSAGYGNAILSRFAIGHSENIDVTVRFTKRRSVLHARVRVPGTGSGRRFRTVHIFNLHLGLSQVLRRLQLTRFLDGPALRGLHARTPVLLAGDFNDVWGTLGSRYLHPRGFKGMEAPLRTFPAWAPVRALDSIYVRGDASILSAGRSREVLARRASDHLPLVADVQIG